MTRLCFKTHHALLPKGALCQRMQAAPTVQDTAWQAVPTFQSTCLALLLLASVLAGCGKEKTIVGRWATTNGAMSYYFREDGILFYRSPTNRKYQGAYSLDTAKNPMIVKSHLTAMDGGMDAVDVEFKVSFVTSDRLQLEIPTGKGPRKHLLVRTTDAELAKSQAKPPPKRRGPIILRRP